MTHRRIRRAVRTRVAARWLACAAIAPMMSAANAAEPPVSFAGKTIEMIVGGTAGGGYDAFARAIGKHLPKHVAGHPAVVVKNMPGAGSAKAATYVYGQAPKDGTAIGAFTSGVIIEPLLNGAAGYGFDPKAFRYLATADNGTRTCMTYRTSATKTYEDARRRETVMGATQSSGSTQDYARLSNVFTGTKFKIVSGYNGSTDVLLAMERGEVEGVCGLDYNSLLAIKPDWARDKMINVLVQVGLEPEPAMTKMGVPQFWSFVGSAADRRAAELVVTQQVFGRPYVVPPGTPQPVVDTLRQAFDAVLADPDLLADAERARLDIDPLGGAKVQEIVEKLYAAAPDDIARAKAALTPREP